MKFTITTVSINRATRQQHAPPRTELIDTDTDELYNDLATPLQIERKYEEVWNDPECDLSGEGLVEAYELKVIGVDPVLEGEEAWVAEAAQALHVEPQDVKLAVQRERLARAARRIADRVEQERNPPSGKLVW